MRKWRSTNTTSGRGCIGSCSTSAAPNHEAREPVVNHEGHEEHEGRGKIFFFVIFVSFVVFTGVVTSAQDRVAAAKKEGALTLYTTIAEKDLPTLIRPFEAKYGSKVTAARAATSNGQKRAVQQTTTKKYDGD